MRQTDGWLIGVLAMIYLFLDSSFAPRRMSNDSRELPSPDGESTHGSRLLPVPATPRGVCPRNHLHPVTLRGDGAMWCRACDEAFYPHTAIWSSLGRMVVV